MGNMFSNLPYFWSAQLDEVKDSNPKDTSRFEALFGFFVCNFAVWVTVVALDIHLLATEFKNTASEVHILQTAALVSVSVSAGTMLLFTLVNYWPGLDYPFSSGELGKEARVLPPFATALIVGGLKATNWFTILLLILAGLTHEKDAYKMLVAQACLKTFGTAMALANQRYKTLKTIGA